ncbi:putative UDP-glucose 4-epimerase [Methanocella conradii HZ254]|uniref:UDP-glucose 4-epimerase n=1 Tax=Methanocella conradii (strain DSM 24694 / JCM 17849 / CGMCC 1.5162 / HZ254) TaxID=1041930 RepID=H8I4M3_METCZ|nr:putative UDP-glucose 4-epimerase [Methanocella conradii HZ254]
MNPLIGKRVIITGGAGFIGSSITEELCNENEVIVIDDLSTGRIENIQHLIKSEKIKFIKDTITNIALLKRIFKDADYVFHQAAIPSVPRSISDPILSNEAGITGTLCVLVAAHDCGVKKVIYASSSSVYGDTPTLPKRENMASNPLSPYALTKLAGEQYCRIFNEIYGLSTISLRYFNVYGPRQDPGSEYAAVIPGFIAKTIKGEPITIYGDGEQTRDFTYIKDVVQANIRAAESSATGYYNIAGGKRTSINELADTICRIVGRKVEIRYAPPRPGDIKHSLADITKAKEAFGYEPKYDLWKGLEETVGSFKSTMGDYNDELFR